MPGSHHLPGASPKENRQYEHIKESELKEGRSTEDAKRIAASTVNKQKHKMHTYGEDAMKNK